MVSPLRDERAAIAPNRASFQQEWDRYCDEVLTPNPAADYLMKVIEDARFPI